MARNQARPTYRRAQSGASTSNADSRQQLPAYLKLVALLAVLAVVALAALFVFGGSSEGDPNGVAEPEEALAETSIDSDLTEAAATRTVTISFAGDCTLGTDENFGFENTFVAKYDEVNDPSYFLRNVEPIFSEDDITIVNVEGTLTDSTTRKDKTFAFKGSPEYAGILTAGSVEVAGFANNHDSDYGDKSHDDTVVALQDAGIEVASESKIAYKKVNGVNVALVAMYELADHRDIEENMVRYISKAREDGADLVLVYFHWGNEREYTPDENQIYLGHAAVDAGADMVVGSHPHVVQGYEQYNGRYIFYSLGNFCYGGHSNPEDKDTMIVQKTFTLDGDGVVADDDVTVIPCSISSVSTRNNYQPTPAEGDDLNQMLAKLDQLNANVEDALASYSG